MGKEIVTLLDEYRTSGKHEIIFDVSVLSSGVYIFKIIVDNYSNAKKMVVLK
jgi:hypothetical protein